MTGGRDGLSYTAAGVDVGAYQRMLARVGPLIAGTHGPEVASGVGPFAGLYALPGAGYLAASADGVGTKIKVAIAAGSHRGIGIDLVNHCINDIATTRARPLFFLDYFASARLDPDVFGSVMEGLSAACGAAGCALLGGETAEMPGMYALGDYDLAGFIVGVVDREQVPDLSTIRAGDSLVALPASGLHTNGFSLVRRVFDSVPLTHVFPELGRPLAEELLEPHRCYLGDLNGLRWKSAAHLTGGGFFENVPRSLPDGLAARFVRGSWDVPPIFRLISQRGQVLEAEMYSTFNMGVGMVLVCETPPPGLQVIGEVVPQGDGPRVLLA